MTFIPCYACRWKCRTPALSVEMWTCWTPRRTESFVHCFPADPAKRTQWLQVLGLSKGDIQQHTCICSHHILYGDTECLPPFIIWVTLPRKLTLHRGKEQSNVQYQVMSPPFQPPLIKQLALIYLSKAIYLYTCSSNFRTPASMTRLKTLTTSLNRFCIH